ncbi:helix-turn-helix domain-containing protein [Paracoccus sp. YIM 132242]|uniref:Helix-turn-helix domain-containing protein n=1 Tax=Paracoccus lichenicola TaxID=2665644 RepID=A0A6L6HL15_9RHOB|nr:AraC family transcriptional regulator [Paracoccus lichenicola]MTD98744.1 helix-turn-helix domain-containing protein [Paracoccus lichenicola]
MTAFEHSQWKDGFPFSPSQIRAGRRLGVDGVNAPFIADAPQPVAGPPAIPQPQDRPAPAALQPAWREAHPVGRQSGIRLLPLAAFLWGSRANPPQPRTRPDHVLIWVTQGRVQLDFPRDRFCLRSGDLRYIPAGTAFAASPAHGTTGHVALISARLGAQAVPPLPDHVLAAQVGNHAAQLEATLREIGVETPGGDPGTLSCLVNLLSLRLRQLAPGRAPDMRDTGFPDRPLIDRFLALAREQLGESRSVAELAAELGSSTLQLDQACLAAHGKRAVALMHQLRLDCAARMLRETARPTQRIAADLGYSSHAHFIRAFVAATGRTPDAFRAQSC